VLQVVPTLADVAKAPPRAPVRPRSRRPPWRWAFPSQSPRRGMCPDAPSSAPQGLPLAAIVGIACAGAAALAVFAVLLGCFCLRRSSKAKAERPVREGGAAGGVGEGGAGLRLPQVQPGRGQGHDQGLRRRAHRRRGSSVWCSWGSRPSGTTAP